MKNKIHTLSGSGLGFRRALMSPFESYGDLSPVKFMEVAPENWITVGGRAGKRFRSFAEKYPMILHGLSLSIGGPDPLDETFIKKVKIFMDEIKAPIYSEHLSYCTDGGHLYDLMPIPFTQAAVKYVADRISKVQDIIGAQIAIENVSYYAAPGQEMTEIEFINEVIKQADCLMLLDVNNIYVNSINHKYDAIEYLKAMPGERIAYGHIAGHYNEAEDLIVDTHGAEVIGSVWDLLDKAYELFGVYPTLLERDFNFPEISELISEVEKIESIQQKHLQKQQKRA